ncbi:major urinary protein 4-like [Ctenodactylus gundi]
MSASRRKRVPTKPAAEDQRSAGTADEAGRPPEMAVAGLEGSGAVRAISGKWYSVGLASDQKEKIEEEGSMRVFVEYIHALENSSLAFKLHTIVDGKCKEVFLVADKTEKHGVYAVHCREPDVSPELKEKFVEICQKYGIAKENILDLTNGDRCLEARDE